MDQILHILKKDVRRHWPEILISLALLALYTHRELQPWRNAFEVEAISRSPLFYILSERYFAPALIIFWIFLVIRVVQGESLVGDRQWWTTKPYIWWQLLLAKLLFIFVFVCVPLFLVQLFLLHHFQYPILSNVPALAMMQFSLFTLLVVFVVLLASLTKNLGQLLLVVGVIVLIVGVTVWIDRNNTTSAMEDTPPYIGYFLQVFGWGSVAVVSAWQFARRRRWLSIDRLAQADAVSYAWQSYGEPGFPNPELNPISDYSIWFQPVSLTSTAKADSSKVRQVRLCPGTELTVSRPVLTRHLRIQFDLPNTRLEDLAEPPLHFTFR